MSRTSPSAQANSGSSTQTWAPIATLPVAACTQPAQVPRAQEQPLILQRPHDRPKFYPRKQTWTRRSSSATKQHGSEQLNPPPGYHGLEARHVSGSTLEKITRISSCRLWFTWNPSRGPSLQFQNPAVICMNSGLLVMEFQPQPGSDMELQEV